MSTDIVKALRATAEIIDDPGDNAVLKMLKSHMTNAVDTIESLREDTAEMDDLKKQLAVYRKYGEPWEWSNMKANAERVAKLSDENGRLMKYLDESQRRERAAVEDLKDEKLCLHCKNYSRADINRMCLKCTNKDKWQWRGPVVGEGEK